MSIQSEVSRIDGAKGALKTAIEGKGVAVPEDTRIEGYAALVAEIPQGTGDMLASVYDPQNKAQDVFAYADGKAPLVVTITTNDEWTEFTSSHDAFEIVDAFRAGRVVFATVEDDVWMLDIAWGNKEQAGRGQAYFRYLTISSIADANGEYHSGIVDLTLSVTTQATDSTLTNFETLVSLHERQIDALGVGAVPLAGGTMTGALTLSGAPTADLHAATKKYVDDSVPDITGKADKAVPTAAGNVAALDAEGNLQDSGKPFTAAGIGAAPAIHDHPIIGPTGNFVSITSDGAPGDSGFNDQSFAAYSHAHTAGDISGGTLGITRGGTGVTSHTDTTYTTARYRASALVSADTDPTTNGVINWTYE